MEGGFNLQQRDMGQIFYWCNFQLKRNLKPKWIGLRVNLKKYPRMLVMARGLCCSMLSSLSSRGTVRVITVQELRDDQQVKTWKTVTTSSTELIRIEANQKMLVMYVRGVCCIVCCQICDQAALFKCTEV